MKYLAENIPLPTGRTDGITASLRSLRVGQAITIPPEDLSEHSQKGVFATAKRIGIRITTRTVSGGLRVWRIGETANKPQPEQPQTSDVETPITTQTKFENANNNSAMEKFLAKLEAKKPTQKVVETEPEFIEPVIDYEYDGGA